MEGTSEKKLSGQNHLPVNELLKLSKLLRRNGDKILNNSTKLVLTPSILNCVSNYLETIVEDEFTSSFEVLSSNYIQGDIVYSLQFLHDFFQKVPYLKISNSLKSQSINYAVILKRFHSLEFLEIKNVPIYLVEGLQYLRKQLKVIKCSKCCNSLESVFIKCGKDSPIKPFIWENLFEISLPNNNIRFVDTSLKYLPHLKLLNLSQNILHDDSFSNFVELPNLLVLDLSFNFLEHVPYLPTTTSAHLVSLNLQNNCLQDFIGIQSYFKLEAINASYNCLLSHSHLLYLQQLKYLKDLNLIANPIHYHPRHRALSLLSLDQNILTETFILNGRNISKYELAAILSDATDKGVRSPNWDFSNSYNFTSPASQVPTASYVSSVSSSYNRSWCHNSSIQRPKSKKGSVIREALIHNKDDDESSSLTTVSTCDTVDSMVHLRTKQKLEQLRSDYGQDNWLYSQSGNQIKDILGFRKETDTLGILDTDTLEHKFMITSKINDYSSPREEHLLTNSPSSLTKFKSKTPETVEDNLNEYCEQGVNGEGVLELTQDFAFKGTTTMDDYSPYSLNKNLSPDDIQSDEEGDIASSFKVERRVSADDYQKVNLKINNLYIKETSCDTGLTLTKWNSNVLLSACLVSSNPDIIEVKFNTVVRVKQERYYKLITHTPNEILSLLRPLINSKHHFEQALQCIKCSSIFSNDVAKIRLVTEHRRWRGKYGKPSVIEEQICPNCGSNMLIVVEEDQVIPGQDPIASSGHGDSQIDQEHINDILPGEEALSTSALESDITTDKLESNLPISMIHQVTVDVHTVDENETYRGYKSDTFTDIFSPVKGSDSDIEVISNPSQGSVEVISDPSHDSVEVTGETKYPSSVVCSSALTSLAPLLTPGLSDSMSSGSMEASVCTLYNCTEAPEKLSQNSQLLAPTDSFSTASTPSNQAPDTLRLTDSNVIFSQADPSNTLEDCLTFTDYCQQSGNMNAVPFQAPILHHDSSYLKESSTSLMAWLYSKCVRTDANTIGDSCDSDRNHYPRSGKVAYSYSDFTKVDHRLKLFMNMMIMDDQGEELFCLLKADILPSENRKLYPGLIVFSNKKLYILKITGCEGDQPERWLKRVECQSLVELSKISLILGDQGIMISFQSIQPYLVLLKDVSRSHNFINWLQSHRIHLHGCDFAIDDIKVIQQTTLTTLLPPDMHVPENGDIFYSLCYFKETDIWNLSNLIIIENDLLIESRDLSWLVPSTLHNFDVTTQQNLTNLVSVILFENFPLCLKLEFLLEDTEESIQWLLGLETLSSVKRMIDYIRTPWEDLFGVELELNIETYCF